MSELRTRYDALVIGAGISGMQAALDLASQGYEVLLVERQPSIGGVMVGLNKVFPTLDCSSCICTPRMAEASHHERITLRTWTEVERIDKLDYGFQVRLREKPRFVDEGACIGCARCEAACPVTVPHAYDHGLVGRKAIYIEHGNAIPQVPVLDLESCTFCGRCAKVCPTDCIDFLQEPRERALQVGAVVAATGLELTPIDIKPQYGGGQYANVIGPLTMERIQSSDGPYGRVLRPSDGKIPRRIAYVQCAGSRDRSIRVPYCSRVCCMYALKQALLLRHYVHDVDVTIYHMDIRAFGKGYEQFYRRALAEGVRVEKGKVARISELDDGDLVLRVELLDQGGRVRERRYDLVVLSLGVLPGWHPAGVLDVEEAPDGFFHQPEAKLAVARTSMAGVFAGGVAAGPKDIPDAIVEAGEAAMAAANYLRHTHWTAEQT